MSPSGSKETDRPPREETLLEYLPSSDYQFPFGTYEFALPPAFDPMLSRAMEMCMKEERTEVSFPFSPVISGSPFFPSFQLTF